MSKKIWLAALGLLVVIMGTAIGLRLLQPYEYRGSLIDPAMQAPDLPLIDSNRSTFTLESQRGKVVLLFFGYTSCPDVCPTTLSDLKQVYRLLGQEAERVQVLFVTVDPQRDTADQLNSYLPLFHPTFLGLTGDLHSLEQAWKDYGVFREVDTTSNTAAGYLVSHSSRLYLIDPQGDLLLTYSYGTPPEDIAKDVANLLDE